MSILRRLSKLEQHLPLNHAWLIMQMGEGGEIRLIKTLLPCKPPESHEQDMKELAEVMNNPQPAHKL